MVSAAAATGIDTALPPDGLPSSAGPSMSGGERAAVFAALADGYRRQLLDRLRAENGQSLAALCQGLDISRQAVTKHLQVLEASNLVGIASPGPGEAALSQPGADPRRGDALAQPVRRGAAR